MKTITGFFGFIFVAILAGEAPAMAQTYTLPELKASLQETPIERPTMLNKDTRLDRIEGGHQEAVYFNTLVNYTYDQFPDPQVLLDGLAVAITNSYCGGEQTKAFRDAGITLLHLFYDKNGELIGTIKTNPGNCE